VECYLACRNKRKV